MSRIRDFITRKGGRLLALAGVAAVQLAPVPAHAFGTIGLLGQDHEHQKITRMALAGAGFGKVTMDRLAGTAWRFGAVGSADAPWHGLVYASEAHCDNGDYIATSGYPDRKAAAADALARCRDNIRKHLAKAVTYAGGVTDTSGLGLDCDFNPSHEATGRCRVLLELGLAFHTTQDFYAHTNWVDAVRAGPVSLADPQGLGQTGPAPWLVPDAASDMPDGLISGCWEGMVTGLRCRGRIDHGALNKDTGAIDMAAMPPAIGDGTTRRSRDGAFRLAVEAARDDTLTKWTWFQEQVVVAYGQARGAQILCLIVNDAPSACKA